MRKLASFILLFVAVLVQPGASQQADDYAASFDLVWQTMRDEYFDPEMGGLDWTALYEEYQPQASQAESALEFCQITNRMLWQLNVSHLGVVPAEEVEQASSPELTATGTIGLDVRLLGNDVVVTRVAAGSPAAEAGIAPGDAVLSIAGRSVDEIKAEALIDVPPPPGNELFIATQEMLRGLYVTAGSVVVLEIEDSLHNRRTMELTAAARTSGHRILPELPPIFAEVESRVIAGDIGYLRFTCFHPAVLADVLATIDELLALPAMVIDLRGNPGGEFATRLTIAEKLVDERTLIWRQEYNDHDNEVYLEPAESPYRGQLVILIDELSGSSAEEFTGGLKSIGRACVVGVRSRGAVLIMDAAELPDGSIFIYPVARTVLADGTVLEGRGVEPDISAPLDNEALQRGVDNQLEAALEFIRAQTR